jgi:hydrogenase maturation protease
MSAHPGFSSEGILIMGIGNVLMGDEGVGVHFIQWLEEEKLPEEVDLLDGGTAGFELMSWMERYPDVILVDATLDGSRPGTIRYRKPRFSEEFPKAMSTHDIGLKDLMEGLSLLGKLPAIHLFTVSIPEVQPMKIGLSEAVQLALPQLAALVRNKVDELLGRKVVRKTAGSLPDG